MNRVFSFLGQVIPVVALIFIVLIVGVFLGRANLPPSRQVDDAGLGLISLIRWAELYLPFSRHREPHLITHQKPNLVQPSQDIGDGELTALSHYTKDSFKVSVINRKGEIVHQWHTPDSVFDALLANNENPAIAEMLRPAVRAINGFEILADGSLVFNYTNAGLIKMDVCSNVDWVRPFRIHHDLTIDQNGNILALGEELVDQNREDLPRINAPYQLDTVHVFSQDGEELEVRNLLSSFFNNRSYGGFLFGNGNQPSIELIDLTHTNDVEAVSAAFASHHDFVNEGDLLVSYRNINMIAIIDRQNWQMKWSMQAPFVYQHDPDAMPDGTISVYDNRTASSQWNQPQWRKDGDLFGSSRIIRIDPTTQQIVWEFEGNETIPFYSTVQGRHTWIGDERVMIVEPEAGRIFEVDAKTKALVWEFWNVVEETDEATLTGRIIGGHRLPGSTAQTIISANCN